MSHHVTTECKVRVSRRYTDDGFRYFVEPLNFSFDVCRFSIVQDALDFADNNDFVVTNYNQARGWIVLDRESYDPYEDDYTNK